MHPLRSFFDYQAYWIRRHKQEKMSLRSVGYLRFSDRTNALMYRKVQEILEKALHDRNINLKNKKVLDAGAGIGLYASFYLAHGAHLTSIDISSDALAILHQRFPEVIIHVSSLENLTKLGLGTFFIVHCFDVLYHITDDRAYVKALDALCNATGNYLIVHDVPQSKQGRFLKFFKKDHVKFTRDKFNLTDHIKNNGLVEVGYYPTHLLFTRFPLDIFVNLLPYPFYLLDKFLLSIIKIRGLETSCIRIFKRYRA